jgi:predicted CoA-substrate-specific enzyme activase
MTRDRSLLPNKFYIGIDIGSVSTKIVVLTSANQLALLEKILSEQKNFQLFQIEQAQEFLNGAFLLVSDYTRILGEPVNITFKRLQALLNYLTPELLGGIRVTGSGAPRIAELIHAPQENEFRTLAHGVGMLYPEVNTILEIGGESSKFISISVNPASGEVAILDYSKNGDCAAGTGVFMDQQAARLLYRIEDVGKIVGQVETAATIAGRCSVFAKSDMIHAQQKGYQPAQILKGLCDAVIRNFKGTIVKGKHLGAKVAFIGGVAGNDGAVKAVRDVFEMQDRQLIVPELHASLGAAGAAMIAALSGDSAARPLVFPLPEVPDQSAHQFPRSAPLSLKNVTLLRNLTTGFSFTNQSLPIDSYLGIDIGSVSTKLVVIDATGNLIKEIYTRTDARPIEVVSRALAEIDAELGAKIRIQGVATTGSGRELIGQLVGADTINDEITAHKTGAAFIGDRLLNRPVDTIFDIGGQDAKFISIENGVVVDFTMNEACAAGTGSFLEEQAERLGINIINEFSEMALGAVAPIRLGERCTVFMEKVLTPYLQQGAKKDDLVAGLAYSIVSNYLNRVVRGRKIGQVVFFQGGTAYNDAVAAAFSTVLGKEIIVPPYNGVLGAVGAALIARDKMRGANQSSRFRGFKMENVDYKLRNFTCKSCANFCEIQEFTVAGEKTYWGNKCSDRYRKSRKSNRQPDIPDLLLHRDELFAPFLEPGAGAVTLGMPRSIYHFNLLPFWSTYLRELGFKLVFSESTNKKIVNKGVAATVAEPCFPIVVAHGHIQDLIERGVDYIFQPNMINAPAEYPKIESFYCPWGQTQPFVFQHTPQFQAYWKRILRPTIRFREGVTWVQQSLREFFKPLAIQPKISDSAVLKAYHAQAEFDRQLLEAGKASLDLLRQKNARAIVLVGRPYNLYDRTISLNIPTKLREYYGINLIPIDFIPLEGIDVRDVNDSMFWDFGMKILKTARFVSQNPRLDLIYITNFKCGPDSYIKHFVNDALRKPFLVLQFDGHSNDAGSITRCEAYLDSKGFI